MIITGGAESPVFEIILWEVSLKNKRGRLFSKPAVCAAGVTKQPIIAEQNLTF